jgi:hypothetical protein
MTTFDILCDKTVSQELYVCTTFVHHCWIKSFIAEYEAFNERITLYNTLLKLLHCSQKPESKELN